MPSGASDQTEDLSNFSRTTTSQLLIPKNCVDAFHSLVRETKSTLLLLGHVTIALSIFHDDSKALSALVKGWLNLLNSPSIINVIHRTIELRFSATTRPEDTSVYPRSSLVGQARRCSKQIQ